MTTLLNRTPIFSGGTRLDELADDANASHRACEQAARSMLVHARDCGRALWEAKRRCQHGQWLPWLAENCDFSDRQARRYMKIAANWTYLCALSGTDEEGLPNWTRASDLNIESLSMREALRILADGETGATATAVSHDDNSAFHWLKCPSCGHQLGKTSKHWATCINCSDCRLFGISNSKIHKETPVLAMFRLWDQTPPSDRAYFLRQIHAQTIADDIEHLAELEDRRLFKQTPLGLATR